MPGSGGFLSHSLKGVIWGIIEGTTIGVINGDTRSLDYSSYRDNSRFHFLL